MPNLTLASLARGKDPECIRLAMLIFDHQGPTKGISTDRDRSPLLPHPILDAERVTIMKDTHGEGEFNAMLTEIVALCSRIPSNLHGRNLTHLLNPR